MGPPIAWLPVQSVVANGGGGGGRTSVLFMYITE
jgi:hypothetical protein